jgi:hypothetical protein
MEYHYHTFGAAEPAVMLGRTAIRLMTVKKKKDKSIFFSSTS